MKRASFRTWRIASQFTALTFPIILLMIGVATWLVYQNNIDRIHERLTKRSQSISQQVKADRDYYARVIVPRVIEIGGQLDAAYHRKPGSFPLPITFAEEVAEQLTTQGSLYQLNFVSLWPLNQKNGVSDGFQREAFTYLQGHPPGEFYRLDTVNGRSVFRYMSADRATAQSCLDCHNNHPLSAKRDFKLNDVMGGIEIVIPVEPYLQESRTDLQTMIVGGAVFCLILLGVISFGAHRLITQPLAQMAHHMDLQANKLTGGLAIPSTTQSGHNELSRFQAFFKNMEKKIFAQQTLLQQHESALAVSNVQLQGELEQQRKTCLACTQRLRTVLDLDSAHDAIIYIDSHDTIQWCNPKAEALAGQSEANLVGRPIWEVLTPGLSSKIQTRLTELEHGGPVSSGEDIDFFDGFGKATRKHVRIATMYQKNNSDKIIGRILALR